MGQNDLAALVQSLLLDMCHFSDDADLVAPRHILQRPPKQNIKRRDTEPGEIHDTGDSSWKNMEHPF
eukprot:1903706-Prorocentrum_lima.AAC.1